MGKVKKINFKWSDKYKTSVIAKESKNGKWILTINK